MPIISGSKGGAPTGAAGGGLAGTYPNPTIASTWTTFAPATTGITGEAVAVAQFIQVGNIVFLVLGTSGTGSTTARTFTLPVATGPNGAQWGGNIAFVKDGGVTATNVGGVSFANNSTVCTLFKTPALAAGSWTASGAWQINLMLFYGTN